MGTFSTGRKVASFGSLILGLVLAIAGLALSISKAGDLILATIPINGTATPIIMTCRRWYSAAQKMRDSIAE